MNRQSFIGRLLVFKLLAISALLYADESEAYSYVYIGNNIGNTRDGTLTSVNYKGSSPGEFGIGTGRFVTDDISIEGIMEYWGERFERDDATILAGTYNNIIQVTSMGLSTAAIYHYTNNSFDVYLGIGAGYFNTGILITDPDSTLLTEAGAPSDKWLVGYHASFGVNYGYGEQFSIGVELKQRKLYADFGPYTNGKVNVGGTYMLIVLNNYF